MYAGQLRVFIRIDIYGEEAEGRAKEEVQGGAGPVGFWSAFWGALDTSPSGRSCSELKQPGISDLSPKPQPLAQEEGPATRIHVRVP